MSPPPPRVLVGPDRRHGPRPLGLPRLVVPVQLPWLVRLPSAHVEARVRTLVGVPRRPIGPADSRRPSFNPTPSWGMRPSPSTELLIHRPAMKPPQPDLTPRLAVHFSSATDEWPTPQYLFDALHSEFKFTVDVCATSANAKCRRFYTRLEDGLQQDWRRDRAWMNPPYGEVIARWVGKAFTTAQEGGLVVALVPARPDTAWWHDYVLRAAEIRFLRGRLKFEGARHPAPFPSAVVVFRPPLPVVTSVSVKPGRPSA